MMAKVNMTVRAEGKSSRAQSTAGVALPYRVANVIDGMAWPNIEPHHMTFQS